MDFDPQEVSGYPVFDGLFQAWVRRNQDRLYDCQKAISSQGQGYASTSCSQVKNIHTGAFAGFSHQFVPPIEINPAGQQMVGQDRNAGQTLVKVARTAAGSGLLTR